MSLAHGVDFQKCGDLTTCTLSGWSLFEYVLFCYVFWWISYCFLMLLTKQSEEWCCRLLTLVHGCIISYTSICDIIANKRGVHFQNEQLSEPQKDYLSFMLSYFLFDFCWFHFFGNESWVIYFHHLTSIVIILKILVSNYGGGGISYAVAGLELTNPYLQLRWFLRTHGYLNTRIHTVVELWFFCLFSLIRTIGGTILFYYGIISYMDWGMKLSFLCIYVISLVLQWQIITYFIKKYRPGNQANVNLTYSRVSISQYFQRKTLDRPVSENDSGMTDENAASKRNNQTFVTAFQTNEAGIALSCTSKGENSLLQTSKNSNAEENPTADDEAKVEEALASSVRTGDEEIPSLTDGNERQQLDE